MRATRADLKLYKGLFTKRSYSYSRVETEKDYYKLLGVTKDTQPSDIKKSFFKLAKKYHPDTNPTQGEKFKEINEAYQVLSNVDKKREYDEVRSSGNGSFFGGFNQSYSNNQQTNQQQQQQSNDSDDIFKKYGYSEWQKKKQQQQNEQNQDNFFYYWENQKKAGNNNNNNANTSNNRSQSQQNNGWGNYQQSQQTQNSQHRQTEEEMKEFIKKMYAGQDAKFNEFVNSYRKNKQYNPKTEYEKQQFHDMWQKQQAWGQQQKTAKPEYGYDPYEFYQRNKERFQEQYKDNSYYKSDAHQTFQGNMANGRDTWSKMQQEFAKERIEEDTKREREYQERKRIQDENFKKEFYQKVQKTKEDIKNVGEKVDQAAYKAEKVIADFGGKVMNFFKNKS